MAIQKKMEDKKCCAAGSCEKCKNSKMCMFCPCHWSSKQCHIMRILGIIIVLLVTFSLGTSFGEHKNGFEGRGYGQKYMMNRGNDSKGLIENRRAVTGTATVEVSPNTQTAPITPTTTVAPTIQ